MVFFDHIDDFLRGKLAPQEKAAFEAALANDAELREELAFRKEVQRGLVKVEAEAVRKRLRAAIATSQDENRAELPPEQVSKSRNQRRNWALAATILLLATAGYWLFQPQGEFDHQAVFQEYFQPQPRFNQSRAVGSSRPSLEDSLQSWFHQSDFSSICTRLGAIPEAEKNLDQLYLEAIALIETRQNFAAHKKLEFLSQSGGLLYKDEAKWGNALLYIRENKLAEAKELLEEVANNKAPRHEKEARDLLEILPKPEN